MRVVPGVGSRTFAKTIRPHLAAETPLCPFALTA